MTDDMTAVFNQYLNAFKSIDIAEAEFKKDMHEDPELKAAYREWCANVGSSEKKGFFDFCEEFFDSQDTIWETLSDYNED